MFAAPFPPPPVLAADNSPGQVPGLFFALLCRGVRVRWRSPIEIGAGIRRSAESPPASRLPVVALALTYAAAVSVSNRRVDLGRGIGRSDIDGLTSSGSATAFCRCDAGVEDAYNIALSWGRALDRHLTGAMSTFVAGYRCPKIGRASCRERW